MLRYTTQVTRVGAYEHSLNESILALIRWRVVFRKKGYYISIKITWWDCFMFWVVINDEVLMPRTMFDDVVVCVVNNFLVRGWTHISNRESWIVCEDILLMLRIVVKMASWLSFELGISKQIWDFGYHLSCFLNDELFFMGESYKVFDDGVILDIGEVLGNLIIEVYICGN